MRPLRRSYDHQVPIINARRLTLTDDMQPWSAEVATYANEEVPGEVEHRHMKIHCNENDDVIALEVKSA